MPLLDKNDSAELVVLSLLAEGQSYGYLLSKEAAARTDGSLRLTPGVLYPLLRQLESDGLIASWWEEVKADHAPSDEPGRRRKWYRLSAKGRKRLESRVAAHRAYTALIDAFVGRTRRAKGQP
jgi:PadR family transcriptional regulator, regulatory protein PadR